MPNSRKVAVILSAEGGESLVQHASGLGYQVKDLKVRRLDRISAAAPDLILFDWEPSQIRSNEKLLKQIREASFLDGVPIGVFYSEARDVSKEILALSKVFALQLGSCAFEELARAIRKVTGNDWPQWPLPSATKPETHGAKKHTAKDVPTIKVFVSHSRKDRDVASAFVEFIRAALPLAAKDIRCTSVDGYKLDPGAESDQQLKQEVFESEVFVALLSPTSLGSVYVLFELGARWGSGKRLLPLMICGAKPSDLKPPLSAIHAGSAVSEGELHQIVATIAGYLNVKAESPSAYLKALKALLDAANAPTP